MVLFPVFYCLGSWQLDRAEEKRFLKNQLEERKSQSAEIFSWEMLDDHAQSLSQLPVQVTGKFLPESRVFFTHRIRLARVGSDVVEPVLLSDGSGAVLVNRGWTQQNISNHNSSLNTAQLGELTFTGKVYVTQDKALPISPQNLEGPWPLKLRTVQVEGLVEKVSDRLGISVFPYLVRIDASQPGALQANWPELKIRSVGHIGYALQWFAMALVTLVVFVLRSSNLWQLLKKSDT